MIEQGNLKLNTDWSGWAKLTSQDEQIRFYTSFFTEKSYYPEYSDEYVAGMPVEITMELSKQTTTIEQSVYTMTDLLIDIGGISRAIVVSGLFLTHFAAFNLYKAALIEALFMT